MRKSGYEAAVKAIKEYQPDELIELVKKSGLRGRGGAGFPTGMKWSFVPKNLPKPTYLVCNADESEPGTFKDRLLIERTPHQIIAGHDHRQPCAARAYGVYLYSWRDDPWGPTPAGGHR